MSWLLSSTFSGGLIGMFQICCMLCVWCGICLGWWWLLCLLLTRIVASVLVRLRECVDRVIVCGDGSVDLTRYVSGYRLGG